MQRQNLNQLDDTSDTNKLFFQYLNQPAIELENLGPKNWWNNWSRKCVEQARVGLSLENSFKEYADVFGICQRMDIGQERVSSTVVEINKNLILLLELIKVNDTELTQQLAQAVLIDEQRKKLKKLLELLNKPTSISSISGPLLAHLNKPEVLKELGLEPHPYQDVFTNYSNRINNEMAIGQNASSHTWEGRLGKLIAETFLALMNLLVVTLGGKPAINLEAAQNTNMPRYMPGIKAS